MCADEFDRENFEETVRDIAREVGKSMERAMERLDLDELAGRVGVDPDNAREWVDTAGGWLRSQVERLGDEVASQAAQQQPAGGHETPEDPWRSAAPHPLDLPTDEQGLALAALESGRWTVEPATERLVARGDGSVPSDALGLVRELRARDWINAEGELTLAGRRALSRWLDSR
jgi:hypothetical protein